MKFDKISYRHLEWVSSNAVRPRILVIWPRITFSQLLYNQPGLLRNFRRKQEEAEIVGVEPVENNGVDPEWTVVQRVIAKCVGCLDSITTIQFTFRETHNKEVSYLVKWENLPYADCTWETVEGEDVHVP